MLWMQTIHHPCSSHSVSKVSQWNRCRSLSFSHTDATYKHMAQRLHLLRKLRSFQVRKDELWFTTPSSVITFNISPLYNQLIIKHKTRLSRIVNQIAIIIDSSKLPLSELYRKANLITEDPSHPLHHSFQLLPSGRRYNIPWTAKMSKRIHPLCNSHPEHRSVRCYLNTPMYWIMSHVF